MRWSIFRDRDLYPRRGLGLWYEAGCLGSTVGEEGEDMFLMFFLLLFVWQFTLRFSWKRIS